MGMILSSLLAIIIITVLVYYINSDAADVGICTALGAGISSLVFGLIIIVTIASSYESYVDIRTQYDATVSQYREAITLYKDNASIDVGQAAFTDLKYQGYQKNMSDFVRDLRKQVTSYNRSLISKRVMGKNWFFNWVIIMPDDDMKILRLVE